MLKITLIFLLIFYWIVSFAQSNEFRTYYVIGNNVNMRADSSLSSKVFFKANFGEEFLCRKISDNWYEWTTGYEDGYISSRYLADEINFALATEKLEIKNGTTLYALLKHYKKAGELSKAEDLSIEIINTYKLKEFPVYTEWCPLYGELAFYAIVKGDSVDIDYSDKAVSAFCSRVVMQSKDSLIIGFALHTLAKCLLLEGKFIESESLLFKSIREYGEHLRVPTSCDYDAERGTSLIVEIKNLAFVLYYLNGSEFRQRMYLSLKNICFDNATSSDSKAIANDIRLKLNNQCWNNEIKTKFTNQE